MSESSEAYSRRLLMGHAHGLGSGLASIHYNGDPSPAQTAAQAQANKPEEPKKRLAAVIRTMPFKDLRSFAHSVSQSLNDGLPARSIAAALLAAAAEVMEG